jgi:hypothetical protein
MLKFLVIAYTGSLMLKVGRRENWVGFIDLLFEFSILNLAAALMLNCFSSNILRVLLTSIKLRYPRLS